MIDMHINSISIISFFYIHSITPNEYSKTSKTSKSIRNICNIGTYVTPLYYSRSIGDQRNFRTINGADFRNQNYTMRTLYIHMLFGFYMRGCEIYQRIFSHKFNALYISVVKAHLCEKLNFLSFSSTGQTF